MTGILGDEIVSATELNRQPGAVLDRAREGLVTIARNREQFVLAPREYVREMSVRQQLQEEAVEVMAAIVGATNGAYGAKYGWLRVFDGEELAEMGSELHEAYHGSLERGDVTEFKAVLHEWRESAAAIASREHEEAYLAESNPVPLTPPGQEEI